ncbi:translation initiation factor eIF-3b like protein [Gonapodya sp. JEL0774]|nr:translation initiation factor eIF-3b like protein [Gonapodya sp. JEL0774]
MYFVGKVQLKEIAKTVEKHPFPLLSEVHTFCPHSCDPPRRNCVWAQSPCGKSGVMEAFWEEEGGREQPRAAAEIDCSEEDNEDFWAGVQNSGNPGSPNPSEFLSSNPSSASVLPRTDNGFSRIALDDNKAGMQGLNKERINSIIFETSKGSRFYQNEARKDEAAQSRIERAVKELERLKTLDLTRERSIVEQMCAKLEGERDLGTVVVHVDMDAFYCAVEERDDPTLKGTAFAVGGTAMLTTASYAARAFGVRAAMPGYIAQRLCPELKFVKPDHAKYSRASSEVRKILSVDEAYLDLTLYLHEHPEESPGSIVEKMRNEIATETGLTASAGIAANALARAHIASSLDRNKPNGQFCLPPDRSAILAFVHALPVRKPPGIGKVTEKFLHALGIKTCGEMWDSRLYLYKLCSVASFDYFMRVAMGIGNGPADEHPTSDAAVMRSTLLRLSQALAEEMAEEKIKGHTLTVKLKRSDFRVFQRSKRMSRFARKEDEIFVAAAELLEEELAANPGMELRLMGVRLSGLAATEVDKNVGIAKPSTMPVATRANGNADNLSHDGDSDHDEQLLDEDIDFRDIDARFQQRLDSLPNPFDSIVVVDNVPIVDKSKEERLFTVIRKTFKQIGQFADDENGGIFMPYDDKTGKSKGFLFLTFTHPSEARLAVKEADGYRLDRQHVLRVNHFADVQRMAELEEEWQEPPENENEGDDGEDSVVQAMAQINSHLLHPSSAQRDQFLLMRNDEVGLFWNTGKGEPELEFSRAQGIALWCGPKFTRVARWVHPGARLVEWSPLEGYACTWGPDVIMGEDGEQWYVARMVQGEKSGIYVYELPGMGLESKKPIRIDEIQAFTWSPTENVLAYWVPEVANNPARVTVTNFHQRDSPLRTKNLFNVADCKMFWSPSGSHLAVQVTRFTKTKKSTFTNFEIFRFKEKEVPVDVVEIKQSEVITQFAWEPSDTTYRFAVLANEGTGAATKTIVYIYDVPPPAAAQTPALSAGKEPAVPIASKVFRQLDRKSVIGVHWSPKGRFMVLRGTGGDVEFQDVDEGTTMAQQEHFGMSGVEWDPSGRYVASMVTGWKTGLDTGYNIYTLTGQPLIRKTLMGLRYFAWRPRPSTLLSAEQMKTIRRNLRKYSEKYDKMDAQRETEVDRESKERQKRLWDEWVAYRKECAERFLESKELRLRLRGWDEEERPVEGAVERDGGEIVEEWVEEVVEEYEEELPDELEDD